VPTPPTAKPAINGYEVQSILGYGGMGVVYKARQVETDRTVALKMLSAGLRARPSELARFQKEAQAASKLAHAHIVEVLDLGEFEGLPYVTMEFMDKGSLAEVIENNPMPPRRAAEVMELLARAVQHAHDTGIIHRDLKPANVLLSSPSASLSTSHPAYQTLQLLGVPKVADFGLAKRVNEEGGQTRTGAVVGTPAYMAPEQAMGKTKELDHACDIWALGAILYECLTGQPPFKAPTTLETLDLVRTQYPTPPSRLQSGIPKALETICLKCLEKSPNHRYATAQQLANDLRRYLDGQSIIARPTPRWRKSARFLARHALAATVMCLALTSSLLAISLWQRGKGNARGTTDEKVRIAHYSNFVKRHGVPEGVGSLTDAQVHRVGLAFRFHYRGKHVEKVEAIDRQGRLNPRHFVSTYLATSETSRFVQSTFSSFLQTRIMRQSLSPVRGVTRNLVAPDTPCLWEYQHDDQGKLVKEVARDVAGRIVWSFQFTSSDTGHYIDERGFLLTRAGSGASSVKFVKSEDGLVKEVRYLGRSGKPRPDAAGIFGRRFEHDKLGLVTAISFFGAQDRTEEHPLGYARVVRKWDDRGHLLEEMYLDLRGKPARGFFASGARLRWTYDADGNPTTQESIGLDGKPTGGSVRMTYDLRGNLRTWELITLPRSESRPVARRELEYDNDDNCTHIRTFGADGKPIIDPVTASCGLALTYDNQGQGATITYLGLDGAPAEAPPSAMGSQPVRGKEVRIVFGYNSRGQLVSEECLGLDDKPIADLNGVAKYLCEYNDESRPVELKLLDSEGEPVKGRQGFASRTWKYDEQGRLAESACFDAEGHLTTLSDLPMSSTPSRGLSELFLSWRMNGSASFAVGRLKLSYDDRGNLDQLALFNEEEQPSADADGIAEVKAKYDEQGNLIELATFDAEGKAKANRQGVARTTWGYDEFGNLAEAATFGSRGKLVANDNGVAKHTRRFDTRYNLMEERFYGADEELTLGSVGYARAEYEYDREDNITKSRYFDTEGKPVKTGVVWLYSADRILPLTDAKVPRPERGDVIVRYDGEDVYCARLFAQRKQREEQGTGLKEVHILREGEAMTLRIPSGVLRRDDFFRFGGRGRGTQVGLPGMLEPTPFVQTRGVTHLDVDS
jgi:YD repeat-containing protein